MSVLLTNWIDDMKTYTTTEVEQITNFPVEAFAETLESVLKAYPTGNVGIFYFVAKQSDPQIIEIRHGIADGEHHFYYWGVLPKVTHVDYVELGAIKPIAIPLDALRNLYPKIGKYDEHRQEWDLTYAEQIQLLEACYEWQGKEFSTLQKTAKRILNFDDKKFTLDMGMYTSGETNCGTTYCLAGWLAFQDNYPEEFRSEHRYPRRVGKLEISDPLAFNYRDYSNSLLEGSCFLMALNMKMKKIYGTSCSAQSGQTL